MRAFQMRSTVYSESFSASDHDATAGKETTLRRYSKPLQDRDGDLNLEVTRGEIQLDGAMGWERFSVRTPPVRTSNLRAPLGEHRGGCPRHSFRASRRCAHESVEVHGDGPGALDVFSQLGAESVFQLEATRRVAKTVDTAAYSHSEIPWTHVRDVGQQ